MGDHIATPAAAVDIIALLALSTIEKPFYRVCHVIVVFIISESSVFREVPDDYIACVHHFADSVSKFLARIVRSRYC